VNRTAPRILIVRLSAIGDIIHGLPVLNALRARFPGAHLSWVVEGRGADLLRDHPALDELVVVPRRWLKKPREVWSLRQRLRALKVDVAVDLQGLSKSSIAGWLSGAPIRIGFKGSDAREISPWLNNRRITATRTHVIDRYLQLLGPLGIFDPAVEYNLPEKEADAKTAAAILREHKLQGDFALLNPGAGWFSKTWPPKRFGEVAQHLAAERDLPSLVVWGGEAERELAQTIVDNSGGAAIMAPATSLLELAALQRRARLFVASDTGPLHLAVAVGLPSVGIFGPMPVAKNGPYGPQHIGLQKAWLDGSSRERRNADNSTTKAVTVEDVCKACDTLLARPFQRARHAA
jgi:heptosyltransferase-1